MLTETIQHAAELLAQQVEAIHHGEDLRRYLQFQARFHRYSFSNALLIRAQRPDATRVAGFKAWLDLGRCVRKGEKGIMIYVPLPRRRTVTDEDGEETVQTRIGFGVGYVFDVAQTDPLQGQPEELPARPASLTWGILDGDDHGLWEALVRVVEAEGLTLTDQSDGIGARGWYRPSARTIYVQPDAPLLDRAATLAHELSHHFAEAAERPAGEVVADGSAFIVLAHFGIDAGASCTPYVAGWSAGKPELVRQELGEMQRVAGTLIAALEKTAATQDVAA
jgi:antirestriction protein ArdC